MPTPLLENKISKDELEKIIDLYNNNISLREIQKITGYNRATVSRMLERLDIKHSKGNHYRKYFFDFDYFEKIDTQDKAYWLGFLYADGCVLPLGKDGYGQQTFKLALQEADKQSIIDFQEDLKSTYPIRYDYGKHSKNEKHQIQVLLEQCSQKTVNDLKKLGCAESKSLILDFPTESQVPSNLIYHFIRGYFDGDGSITYDRVLNTRFLVNVVGTESFIKKMSTYFDGGSIYKDKRKANSWYFSIGGSNKVKDFYNLLYKDAHRYMKRKYDIFQVLINKYHESEGI